jgi:putative FmdB family regulatory protein
MPIYEYACPHCQNTFEKRQTISAASKPTACPSCGTSSQRVPSSFVPAVASRPSTPQRRVAPIGHVGCACHPRKR